MIGPLLFDDDEGLTSLLTEIDTEVRLPNGYGPFCKIWIWYDVSVTVPSKQLLCCTKNSLIVSCSQHGDQEQPAILFGLMCSLVLALYNFFLRGFFKSKVYGNDPKIILES